MKITIGEPWTISNSVTGEGEHIYPDLWKLQDGTLLLDYHLDHDMCPARRACLRSVDNGKTWTPDPPRVVREEAVVQLRDGTVLAYNGHAFPVTPGSKQSKGSMFRSADGGKTFEGPIDVTVNMPRANREPIPPPDPKYEHYIAMVFWRSILELPDGNLLAFMYGWWEGDTKYRAVAAISRDRGLTFDYLSTIGYDPNPDLGEYYEGFDEGILSWTAAGDILCVARVGSFHSLRQTRSSDHGKTWSEPIILDPDLDPAAQSVVEDPANVGIASVNPDMLLMSNGVLACSFGRPGNSIMFDPTGTGDNWEKSIIVYWGGLTGYTCMLEIAPGKLLFVCDALGIDDASGDKANCLRGVEITVERE